MGIFVMSFLEKNLEEIICTSSRLSLNERGLDISGVLFRQLIIPASGIADIVTISREQDEMFLVGGKVFTRPVVTVYELKKDSIGIDAFLQAVRYINGLDSYFLKRNIFNDVVFRIVLIGSDISYDSGIERISSALPINKDGSLFLSCLTYDYKLDGVYFN